MTQKTMYDTIVGDIYTEIVVPYTAGISDEIIANDVSFLPPAPNRATIRKADESALVTIAYAEKTTISLKGITVIQSDTQGGLIDTYPEGSKLSKPLTQDDIQTIQDNIRDLYSAVSISGTTLRITLL